MSYFWKYNNRYYVCPAGLEAYHYSTDLVTWTLGPNLTGEVYDQVEYSGNCYIATDRLGGSSFYKIDSSNTLSYINQLYEVYRGFMYMVGSTLCIAYIRNGILMIQYSADMGETWTEVNTTYAAGIVYQVYNVGATYYILAGNSIYSTTNGYTLSLVYTFTPASGTIQIKDFIKHGSYFYISIRASSDTNLNGILSSSDCLTWSKVSSIVADSFINCSGEAIGIKQLSSPSYIKCQIFGMGTPDAVRSAASTLAGLMGSVHADKLAKIATNSTKDTWKITGTYTGDGAVSKYISIGLQPGYMDLRDKVTAGNWWQIIAGSPLGFRHLTVSAGAYKHSRPVASTCVKFTTYGFKIYSAAGNNVNSRVYYYKAIKETA